MLPYDAYDKPLDGEPPRAYTAFAVYRDLGPQRSFDRAYRQLTGSKYGGANRRWEYWSSQFQWVERVKAFDLSMDEISRKAYESRIVQLARRRAEYEFQEQEKLEELVERVDAVLRKAEAAPITDVTSKKEVDATPDSPASTSVTKVKGLSMSGYARLVQERRDAAKSAILGPRAVAEEKASKEPEIVKGEFTWIRPESSKEE